MTIEWVMWLLPLLFVLHDGEEVVTWSWWMRRKGQHIFSFGPKVAPRVSQTTGQISVAVAVVGLVLLAATVSDVFRFRLGGTPYLFGACLGLWLGHAFVHMATSLYHRMYSPGVVTAVLLCVPHGVYAYMRLFEAGVFTPLQALLSGLAGLAFGPVLVFVAHRVGTALVRTVGH